MQLIHAPAKLQNRRARDEEAKGNEREIAEPVAGGQPQPTVTHPDRHNDHQQRKAHGRQIHLQPADTFADFSRENYAALSAARDDESAGDSEQGGFFTLGVVDAIQAAARDGKHPTVADVRTSTAAFIAVHLNDQHPVADGNDRLIRGALDLIPLRDGQGPTWQALAALAAHGEPLTLTGSGHQLRVGQEIVLGVTLPRAGFLNVVAVDSQDRTTVLYPNKYTPSNEVKAGTFRFPTADMNFVLRAAEPTGPSLVVAFLTDKRVNFLELGIEGRDAAGQMQEAFTDVSARATRAISVETRESQFAAGTLTVKVNRAAAN